MQTTGRDRGIARTATTHGRAGARTAAWACAGLALLLVAAPGADAAKPAKRPKRPKPVTVRYDPERDLAAHLAGRTGVKSAVARMQAAADAGPRTITGTETLSGTVYASSLVIAEGSNVTIEGGATFCISGEMRVEAKLTGALRPPAPAAKLPPVEDIVFEVGGNLVIEAPIEGANGQDRPGVSEPQAASATGLAGGRGQGFAFVVAGDMVLRADIVPGRGGDGEPVAVEAVAPARGLFAFGGDGGAAGNVTIVKRRLSSVEFDHGAILMRRGGRGGSASVKGLPMDPPADCGADGRRAGFVSALGGNGGGGSVVVVSPEIYFVGPDRSELEGQVALDVVEEDFIDTGAETVFSRVTDSAGGDALAQGGPGDWPPDCPPVEPCPTRGRRPGRGGHGAVARAIGGNGGAPPCFAIPSKAFAPGALSAFPRLDIFPGPGGKATAFGGDGGSGASASAALRPAAGAKGGDGGRAEATPGALGNLTRFRVPQGVRVFAGRFLLPGVPPNDLDTAALPTVVAKLYPAGLAVGGTAGGGGDGGDCCGGPSGRGGARGAPGARGTAAIVFPFPGVADAVGPGHYRADPGAGAAFGAEGQGCTPDGGGGSGTGSPSDPFTLPVFNGGCVQLDALGAPLVGFDFYLPGTFEGLATPPRSTVLEFGSSLFGINGTPRDYRVEIHVNGRRIRDEVIPDVAKVAQMAALFVRTPASGKLCVEIRIDGVLRQRLQFDMS